MKFPNECCRCGMCCLLDHCPISKVYYPDLKKEEQCEALSFKEEKASCKLAGVVPIGDGCCLSARAYKNGVEYDVASLPKEIKYKIVEQIRRKYEE